MKYSNDKKLHSQSPELLAIIVEPILDTCIKGASLRKLIEKLQTIIPSPLGILRKYLFYLIDYGIISYDGQNKVYTIKDGGFDLLSIIDNEKRRRHIESHDITVVLEYRYIV